jgi:hypothetical protein
MFVLLGHYPPVEGRSMSHYRRQVAATLKHRGYRVLSLTAPVLMGRLVPTGSGWAKWLGYLDQLVIFPILLFWKERQWPPETSVVVLDQALGPWVPRPSGVACESW